MYYYGARYYDPVISRWISTDPPMMTGEYFPTEELWKKEAEEKQQLTVNYPFKNDFLENHPNVATKSHLRLPGMGGIFNPINIDVYHYAGNNPVRYIDPDGNFLGCGKSQGDIFTEKFFEFAKQEGFELDLPSQLAIIDMGKDIDMANVGTALIFLEPFIKAIPGTSPSASSMERFMAMYGMSGLPGPPGVATDYTGKASDISNWNIATRGILARRALTISTQYETGYGRTQNSELAKFWYSVYESFDP